ncbi:DUF1972 domain-containing protein [Flammeovirgaceae bacterium SG7u.111]|nr:DUF1972 domain-containing protein [Flammeovirgaceae bacterium SG7u.132]WPO34536.1 DUF1972 domain-containing protein [Flammeovirgaceae bacterium SG7u.111]
MKKIAIIGSVGIPAKYGGFETLADQLVKQLKNKFNFVVYCSKKVYCHKDRLNSYNNSKLVYLPLSANGAEGVLYDIISLLHSYLIEKVESILVLGVGASPLFPFLKFFSKNTKIISHIDGLEWTRDKWSSQAKTYLKFCEKIAVKYADIIISDNEEIYNYVYKKYGLITPVIAYGGDHTIVLPNIEPNPFSSLNEKYAFSVCRIEPENNIHIILQSFSLLELDLIIIGNWNDSNYGQQLRKEYSKFSNIHLLDPIFDQIKLDSIRRNCYLYIHGHSAGGTNPSLVEAMWLGLPIIAWDVLYNRYSTKNKAKYFDSPESLKIIIKEQNSQTIKQLSLQMKEVAHENYTWTKIASEYSIIFNND